MGALRKIEYAGRHDFQGRTPRTNPLPDPKGLEALLRA